MNIPVDDILTDINLFEVDEHLRLLEKEDERKALIETVGYSPEKRAQYEKERHLPRGAIDLAMLIEDRQFKALNREVFEEFTALQKRVNEGEEIGSQTDEFYQKVYAVSQGLTRRYPEAMDFLMQYSILHERNRRYFTGDYKFSPEYQLQLANWCPPPGAKPGLNCNTALNLTVNVNLAVNVNAATNIKLAVNIVAWLLIAVAVCVVGPPKLYGPNYIGYSELWGRRLG